MFPLWQEGSLRKEFPKYLKKKEGTNHFLVVEFCFMVVDFTNSRWIDSKVTDHVYNSLQGFQLRRSFVSVVRSIYFSYTYTLASILMYNIGALTFYTS